MKENMIREICFNAATYLQEYSWYRATPEGVLQPIAEPPVVARERGKRVLPAFRGAFLFSDAGSWGVYAGPFAAGGSDHMGRQLRIVLLLTFDDVRDAAMALAGILENWWEGPSRCASQVGGFAQAAIDDSSRRHRLPEVMADIQQQWMRAQGPEVADDTCSRAEPLKAGLNTNRIAELRAYLRRPGGAEQLATLPSEPVPVVVAEVVVASSLVGVWRAISDQIASPEWAGNALPPMQSLSGSREERRSGAASNRGRGREGMSQGKVWTRTFLGRNHVITKWVSHLGQLLSSLEIDDRLVAARDSGNPDVIGQLNERQRTKVLLLLVGALRKVHQPRRVCIELIRAIGSFGPSAAHIARDAILQLSEDKALQEAAAEALRRIDERDGRIDQSA